MGGKAIPGQHWVEVDLGRQCVVEKAVIDWEDGYSNTWTLKVNGQYLEQNVHLIFLFIEHTIREEKRRE